MSFLLRAWSDDNVLALVRSAAAIETARSRYLVVEADADQRCRWLRVPARDGSHWAWPFASNSLECASTAWIGHLGPRWQSQIQLGPAAWRTSSARGFFLFMLPLEAGNRAQQLSSDRRDVLAGPPFGSFWRGTLPLMWISRNAARSISAVLKMPMVPVSSTAALTVAPGHFRRSRQDSVPYQGTGDRHLRELLGIVDLGHGFHRRLHVRHGDLGRDPDEMGSVKCLQCECGSPTRQIDDYDLRFGLGGAERGKDVRLTDIPHHLQTRHCRPCRQRPPPAG